MALDPVALDLADKARVESAALALLPSGIGIFDKDFRLLYANRSFRECVFLSERISDDGEIHLAMIVQRHNEEAVS